MEQFKNSLDVMQALQKLDSELADYIMFTKFQLRLCGMSSLILNGVDVRITCDIDYFNSVDSTFRRLLRFPLCWRWYRAAGGL